MEKKRLRLADRIRRIFGGEPCRVQAAALPWRKSPEGVEVMLITSRETGRWVLPKGWPGRNEPLCAAAAREAMEEAGLSGAISSASAGNYLYIKVNRSGGQDVPCEVLVYPLEVDQVASRWKEDKVRSRKWVSPQEAASLVEEPDLGSVIERFCASPRRNANTGLAAFQSPA